MMRREFLVSKRHVRFLFYLILVSVYWLRAIHIEGNGKEILPVGPTKSRVRI